MSYLKGLSQKSWASSVFLMALIPLAGWAQVETTPQQNPDAASQSESGSPQPAPAPAYGLGTAISSATENPPISGLDQPSLEPGMVTRSFLAPGAILSQSGDSNADRTLGLGNQSSSLSGVTRAMGSITLQKIWANYETDLQYIGGVAIHEGDRAHNDQIHQAELAQRFSWRTGHLTLRDNVSYLPEGSFGAGSFGGSTALQAGLAGLGTGSGAISSGVGSALGGALGADQFGSIGKSPRLTNTAAADLAEALTPRSSITLAGTYGLVHFTGNSVGLINSDQIAAQTGYDRQINRTDQIALSYGFQHINFPQFAGSSVTTNTVHFIYGHRVSGRMDFVAGVGPQFTHIQMPAGSTTRVSASADLQLRYRLPRTSMQLNYKHYNTNGSGFFLGSLTDVGSISASRALSRIWEATADMGVSNHSRLESSSVAGFQTPTVRYLFAGAAVHRHVGRYYRIFFHYQYDRVSLGSSVCLESGNCGTISNRHVGGVGIEWYPRPIRID